jgi:hypothetical protein
VITELRVGHYKSYSQEAVIPFRRITVLLGKNNSGKTAMARLPLALLKAASRRNRKGEPFPLTTRGLSYASTAQELVTGQVPHASFTLGLTSDTSDLRFHLDFEIQLRQSLVSGVTSFVSRFSAKPFLTEVSWIREASSRVEYDSPNINGFDGIFPNYIDPKHQSIVDQLRVACERDLSSLLHLGSLRTPVAPVYENRRAEVPEDAQGREAPYLLNQDAELLARASEWYATHLGGPTISIEREAAAFRILLNEARNTHNLTQAGQGYQQVLPVITYLAGVSLRKIDHRILVIEEPELHLHPAAHAPISDLLVDTTLSNPDAQVIVETHSENLLLRLRKHVATGRILPADVSLLWFEHTDHHGTAVHEIPINEDGSVSNWPTGVFSEGLDEIRAIARERRP